MLPAAGCGIRRSSHFSACCRSASWGWRVTVRPLPSPAATHWDRRGLRHRPPRKTLDRIGLTQPWSAEGPQGVGNITGWAGDGAGCQVDPLWGSGLFWDDPAPWLLASDRHRQRPAASRHPHRPHPQWSPPQLARVLFTLLHQFQDSGVVTGIAGQDITAVTSWESVSTTTAALCPSKRLLLLLRPWRISGSCAEGTRSRLTPSLRVGPSSCRSTSCKRSCPKSSAASPIAWRSGLSAGNLPWA